MYGITYLIIFVLIYDIRQIFIFINVIEMTVKLP